MVAIPESAKAAPATATAAPTAAKAAPAAAKLAPAAAAVAEGDDDEAANEPTPFPTRPVVAAPGRPPLTRANVRVRAVAGAARVAGARHVAAAAARAEEPPEDTSVVFNLPANTDGDAEV